MVPSRAMKIRHIPEITINDWGHLFHSCFTFRFQMRRSFQLFLVAVNSPHPRDGVGLQRRKSRRSSFYDVDVLPVQRPMPRYFGRPFHYTTLASNGACGRHTNLSMRTTAAAPSRLGPAAAEKGSPIALPPLAPPRTIMYSSGTMTAVGSTPLAAASANWKPQRSGNMSQFPRPASLSGGGPVIHAPPVPPGGDPASRLIPLAVYESGRRERSSWPCAPRTKINQPLLQAADEFIIVALLRDHRLLKEAENLTHFL